MTRTWGLQDASSEHAPLEENSTPRVSMFLKVKEVCIRRRDKG